MPLGSACSGSSVHEYQRKVAPIYDGTVDIRSFILLIIRQLYELIKIMCNVETNYVRNYYLEHIIGGIQDKIWCWYVSQRILWKEALRGNMTDVKIFYIFLS